MHSSVAQAQNTVRLILAAIGGNSSPSADPRKLDPQKTLYAHQIVVLPDRCSLYGLKISRGIGTLDSQSPGCGAHDHPRIVLVAREELVAAHAVRQGDRCNARSVFVELASAGALPLHVER